MNLGRNDKCWCGSGLKFKRCHLNREYEEAISKSEAIKISNKIASRECCMVPDALTHECTSKIISAHTVSKSGSLGAIADNTNHVKGLRISLPTLIKNKGILRPEKIGINQASTFKGFCSYHDNSLFSCIEDRKFIGTEPQCFALAYRAVAKEMYAKQNSSTANDFLKFADKGKSKVDQLFFQNFIADNELGVSAAIKELSDFKALLDLRLIGDQSTELSHLVISSKVPPPVMVSSIVAPTVNFNGKLIQDLADLKVVPDYVCFNSFSSDGKGYVVFSWLKDAKISRNFIETFLAIDDSRKFSALVRFFFSVAENTFFSPSWWDELSKGEQSKIEDFIMADASPYHPGSQSILVDDGTDFGEWGITSIKEINFEKRQSICIDLIK
ncbi:hypothetical protein C0W42_00670 [Photobacterium kishitanii]|uniref:YecA family protein n=1 Tax=Photobacterium kishitanii TaxID=318456 RepID=UPI000D15A979|nr:SEC-C metal-binding domain-containing protein [Photobacterium kishitanii]PSU92655.1 hypothetical protein C0W42_00670 [Photobacterium kishitanii]